jgi:hypothetical protein
VTARQEIDRVERVVAERLIGRLPWIPRLPPAHDAAELEQLRAVVNAQQRQIVDLTEKLRAVQAERRRVPVKTLIESVLNAVEEAAATLEGHAISSAHAEIKAALEIDGDMHGLALGSPSAFPPEALSTISFEIGRAAPGLVDTDRREAAAELRAAVLDLQAALDRNVVSDSAPDALDAASAFLATDAPSMEQLRPLVRALEGLAAGTPTVAPAVAALATVLGGADPSSPPQLGAAADALRRIAVVLDSLAA